jgi:16S rRNA (guanine527-N7)-methyltransferase
VTSALSRLDRLAPDIIGRTLSGEERALFGKYLEILSEWNRIHRLVGSGDILWLVDNIVLDSLLFLPMVPDSASRMLDIGSGAGVPGIPLKIMRPEVELVMVESRRRRVSFLSAAIRALCLRAARVVHSRIEQLGSIDLGEFDVVTARCAAAPSRILGIAKRFLRPYGLAIVAGSQEPGADSPGLRRIPVRNPVTGMSRNFVIIES